MHSLTKRQPLLVRNDSCQAIDWAYAAFHLTAAIGVTGLKTNWMPPEGCHTWIDELEFCSNIYLKRMINDNGMDVIGETTTTTTTTTVEWDTLGGTR